MGKGRRKDKGKSHLHEEEWKEGEEDCGDKEEGDERYKRGRGLRKREDDKGSNI